MGKYKMYTKHKPVYLMQNDLFEYLDMNNISTLKLKFKRHRWKKRTLFKSLKTHSGERLSQTWNLYFH